MKKINFKKLVIFSTLQSKYGKSSGLNFSIYDRYFEKKKLNIFFNKSLLFFGDKAFINQKFMFLELDKFYSFDYIIFINFTLKSIRLSICDNEGRILRTYTPGLLEYKKAQRSKVFSIRHILKEALGFIKILKFSRIMICLKGFGRYRRLVLNFLLKSYFRDQIKLIIDLTSIPFNGCRSRKLPRK